MAVEYEEEKAEDTRHWYQKKRYGIPLAIFAIYAIVGGIFGAFDEEPEQDSTTESSQQQVQDSGEQQDTDSEPEPETEPEPEPEPEPAGPQFEDLGDFSVLNVSGTGSDVFNVPSEIVYGAIEVTHSGSSNFVIEGLDANNETTELFVNEIGNYEGTVGYGLGARAETTQISIDADGDWDLSLKPLYTQPVLPESGTGSGVYLFDGPPPVFEITHRGESNFVVQQIPLDARGQLLVNEIGVYSGAVPGVGGKSLVVIEADGDWQIIQR
jgi:hypothetical protein